MTKLLIPIIFAALLTGCYEEKPVTWNTMRAAKQAAFNNCMDRAAKLQPVTGENMGNGIGAIIDECNDHATEMSRSIPYDQATIATPTGPRQ